MGEIGQAFAGRSATFGLPDGLAESPAWEALIDDSGADVAVIDALGRVVYMTPKPQLWCIPESVGDPTGKTLFELFPRALADERLALIQRVSRDRKPLVLMTMWRGVRARATMRPLLVPGNTQPLVLIVCRPVPEWHEVEADPHGQIVSARVVDLGPLAHLTPRELEVLALIGDGATTQEIAERLCRSAKTVEAHRQSLGLKLKAKNRVELARIAARADLTAQMKMRRLAEEAAGRADAEAHDGASADPSRAERLHGETRHRPGQSS